MLPTVFLSLSGKDEAFVKRVQEHLPDGLAYFYPRSFANGENLISAMEERTEQASIFVLFVSRASIESCWVNFEVDRAKLARIKRPDLRLLAFPIEADVTHEELPAWMREYWIPKAGQTPRDIARYIRNVLAGVFMVKLHTTKPYGRGAILDQLARDYQNAILANREGPNVFVFAGNEGIGRRTVEREFLAQTFPGTPELNFGPEFQLPQFADLADLYRAMRQEIEADFSIAKFQRDLEAFNNLSIDERVLEIARNIIHFGELGQSVTIVTGNGIFEDKGLLKPWVPLLFRAMESSQRAKLCIVSNRQIHEYETIPHKNLLQIHIPHLQDSDIRALMIATAPAFGAEPQLPNADVISAIGGHPGIAKATTRLIAQKGAFVLNNDMRELYSIQDEVLSESLDFANLSPIEKDALSILSWVPRLDGQMLKDVIVQRHAISVEEFAESLGNLILSCLVQVSGSSYLISAPIRGLFRRKFGYGSVELRTAFSQALKAAWAESAKDDRLRIDLFDAVIYMIALEGGTLTPEFKGLLLPSTLQEVVRETYDRGHDDDAALKRVVSWGLPAKIMKMDETTREEILSYVVRAQTRLQDKNGVQETLKFIDDRGYRSRFYLRSFFIRHSGGDLNEAAGLLLKARTAKKYMRRVIGDLALCYQKLGMWPELQQLLKDEERYADSNDVLLDVKIGTLIAQGDYKNAEIAIRNLRTHPYEDGRADSRAAMILMQRDRDYAGAQTLL
ncbi:MAG TPA: toll/interleukin-1 receptor domain-containing protein, partial [Rhizomicrobium sp.]|nr:toll/interleukin-1 receptor domain-containing protein [Rhizomicrobium sp.]